MFRIGILVSRADETLSESEWQTYDHLTSDQRARLVTKAARRAERTAVSATGREVSLLLNELG